MQGKKPQPNNQTKKPTHNKNIPAFKTDIGILSASPS